MVRVDRCPFTTADAIRGVMLSVVCLLALPSVSAQPSMDEMVADVQPKLVKVFGAGGLAGLEGYQSGFLVSPSGHVATAWSYVLDAEPLVVLDDGRRFTAEVIGIDPQLELAVLKIPTDGLPYFELRPTTNVPAGQPVFALSNLFGIAAGAEQVSVMHGHVMATSRLDARRGTQSSTYRGEVFVLDLVANNPGAAGGALIDEQGELLGILGKELRDNRTGVWQNYAIPISQLRPSIQRMISGENAVDESDERPPAEPWTIETLGLTLVPDLLDKTPNYVDDVRPDSPVGRAGLQPDDLILMLRGERLDGQEKLRDALRAADRRDPIELLVERDGQILSLTIRP
jgi:serine protease Do